MFVSALIVPDFEALKEYADSHKIPYAAVEELAKNNEIYNLIEKDMSKLQKQLANYERVSATSLGTKRKRNFGFGR